MTTLTDLGVTQSKLRAYGHDGKFEALTGPQLQGICCYLKAHLDKKEGKFKRWSKSVQKEMRGIGITQHQRTGEPCINYRKAKVVENISVSLEDFNRVEDELKAAQETIDQLKDAELYRSKPEITKALAESARQTKDIMDQSIANNSISDPVKPKRTRRTKKQIEADKNK